MPSTLQLMVTSDAHLSLERCLSSIIETGAIAMMSGGTG